MPCRYEIDAAARMVRSYVSGVVSYGDLEANRQQMTGDPAFNADFDQLADCTEVTQSSLTGDQVRQFAMHATFNRRSRRAIVARNGQAAYGVGRMFEIYRDILGGETVRIFTSVGEAEEWLGIRPGAVRPGCL